MLRRISFLFLILLLLSACSNQGKNKSDSLLPRNTESGIEVTKFDKVFEQVELSGVDELHSMMVLKDGKVIYENFDTGHTRDEMHVLWSASKTFTATAIGFAVQDGLLSVEDKVISFFDDSLLHGAPSDSLSSMSIRHLLTMSSGFSKDYISETRALVLKNPLEQTLNTPLHFLPGERFEYNSMNTYLLSAIITKVTGMKLVDYLAEKLFLPLGIEDYIWEESAEGLSSGGWGLYLKTESLAKMGQFMLSKGLWNGERILSSEWFDDAMSVQITKGMTGTPDWVQGYCYQMWKCQVPAVRIDGAWGQFVVILPEQNAVIVTTSHANNTQNILSALWEHVYPSLR